MNVQILKVLGQNEYESSSNPDNVRVSQLQLNVNSLLDHLGVMEKQIEKVTKERIEEREKLFKAWNISDRGQSILEAYANSVSKLEKSHWSLLEKVGNFLIIRADLAHKKRFAHLFTG